MSRFHIPESSDDTMRLLHATLDRRSRPEDVARQVIELLGDSLSIAERKVIDRAAMGSLKGRRVSFTSMSDDFARPVGLQRQCAVASRLFMSTPALTNAGCDDPAAVRKYLVQAEKEIAKEFGCNDFLKDRLDRAERESAGLDLSKRQYNKRFRLATRMEAKRQRLLRELEKRSYTLIGKSRLASWLSHADFSGDPNTASFIAYYVARCNLRSEFTVESQQRPYDEIADVLFDRCVRSATTHWWAIAHAYPDRRVLAHLSDEQKGRLLGLWFGILRSVADFLGELWKGNNINANTMIVARGNDSTTWNNAASAWNKARGSWFSLLFAMGLEEWIERMCPGKVLRLMAADVAAWHKAEGKGLEEDTFVWRTLPFPWEVLAGEKSCGRDMVEAVCLARGLDPVQKGWSAPPPASKVQSFRPTPELVHGVSVGDPHLAMVLRKLGFFSGKGLKETDLTE